MSVLVINPEYLYEVLSVLEEETGSPVQLIRDRNEISIYRFHLLPYAKLQEKLYQALLAQAEQDLLYMAPNPDYSKEMVVCNPADHPQCVFYLYNTRSRHFCVMEAALRDFMLAYLRRRKLRALAA